MSKLYIVYGSTGEYNDRDEWNIAAYADESLAQAHAEAAKRWYNENDCNAKRRMSMDWEGKNPFDLNMRIDYTGTHWSVNEVELRTELPAEAKESN